MAISVSAPATSTRRVPGAFPIFHPATDPAPGDDAAFCFRVSADRAARRSGSRAAAASAEGTASAA